MYGGIGLCVESYLKGGEGGYENFRVNRGG